MKVTATRGAGQMDGAMESMIEKLFFLKMYLDRRQEMCFSIKFSTFIIISILLNFFYLYYVDSVYPIFRYVVRSVNKAVPLSSVS